MNALLMVQFATAWFMIGLIWLVQVVHYPLFAHVGQEQFADYEARHQFLITWVVAPVMILELSTAVWLAIYPPQPDLANWMRISLLLLLAIWISTALVQSRQHGKLADGYDLAAIRGLVLWNWLRTVAWTARGLILLSVFQRLLSVKVN